MMNIYPYESDAHLEMLQDWMILRGMEVPSEKDLPEVGCVAEVNGLILGAGFNRSAEGGYVILDSFVTDPRAPAQDRNSAMDAMIQHLTALAKQHGATRMIAFSVDVHSMERVIRHGFHIHPHVFSIKNISGESCLS